MNRSAVTTGKKLLDGVDCRLPPGRRFADLCRAYERQAREAGGDLSVVGKTMIRQAASLTVMCEQMQADQARCDVVARDPVSDGTSKSSRDGHEQIFGNFCHAAETDGPTKGEAGCTTQS